MKIRVGLLGYGSMGKNHHRLLKSLKPFSLSFVYDLCFDEEIISDGINYFSSEKRLVESLKNVDAVVIATPTSSHLYYIELCLNYVNKIFIEKPMVPTITESNKLLKIYKENSPEAILQVGFIERFNPAVAVVKNLIDNSNDVININFTRTNKISSRITDVDVITDLMIHDIDLAVFLNGKIRSISSEGVLNKNMVGFVNCLIRHQNGRISNIVSSRITDKKIRKIEVTSKNNYIDCNLLNKEVLTHETTGTEHTPSSPYIISNRINNIEVLPREALQEELLRFSEVCNGNSNDYPNIYDNHEALLIADKIRSSI